MQLDETHHARVRQIHHMQNLKGAVVYKTLSRSQEMASQVKAFSVQAQSPQFNPWNPNKGGNNRSNTRKLFSDTHA